MLYTSKATLMRFLALLVVVVPVACGGEPAINDGNEASLRHDVMPILAKHGCAAANCHSDPTAARSHNTDFRTAESTYDSLMNHRSFQHCVEGSTEPIDTPLPGKQRVTPGDPTQSFLLDKLRDTRDACGMFYGRMPPPPSAPVPPAEIGLIERWIAEGARNN
jgi:hypothetical protein